MFLKSILLLANLVAFATAAYPSGGTGDIYADLATDIAEGTNLNTFTLPIIPPDALLESKRPGVMLVESFSMLPTFFRQYAEPMAAEVFYLAKSQNITGLFSFAVFEDSGSNIDLLATDPYFGEFEKVYTMVASFETLSDMAWAFTTVPMVQKFRMYIENKYRLDVLGLDDSYSAQLLELLYGDPDVYTGYGFLVSQFHAENFIGFLQPPGNVPPFTDAFGGHTIREVLSVSGNPQELMQIFNTISELYFIDGINFVVFIPLISTPGQYSFMLYHSYVDQDCFNYRFDVPTRNPWAASYLNGVGLMDVFNYPVTYTEDPLWPTMNTLINTPVWLYEDFYSYLGMDYNKILTQAGQWHGYFFNIPYQLRLVEDPEDLRAAEGFAFLIKFKASTPRREELLETLSDSLIRNPVPGVRQFFHARDPIFSSIIGYQGYESILAAKTVWAKPKWRALISGIESIDVIGTVNVKKLSREIDFNLNTHPKVRVYGEDYVGFIHQEGAKGPITGGFAICERWAAGENYGPDHLSRIRDLGAVSFGIPNHPAKVTVVENCNDELCQTGDSYVSGTSYYTMWHFYSSLDGLNKAMASEKHALFDVGWTGFTDVYSVVIFAPITFQSTFYANQWVQRLYGPSSGAYGPFFLYSPTRFYGFFNTK